MQVVEICRMDYEKISMSMTGRYGIMPQGMLEQRVELVNAIAYPSLELDHLVD